MPEHEFEPEPELDPAADARLRALLATLGSAADPAQRMPDDVVRRLEASLAALSDERAADERAADRHPVLPVDRVAVQRARRSRRSRLVLAAAGVVVAAGVGGVLLRDLPSPTSSGSSATSAGAEDKAPAHVPALGASAARTAYSRSDFRRQVLADPVLTTADTPLRRLDLPAACSGGDLGARVTQRRAITLDGAPAVLTVYAANAGRVLVRAVDCSGQRVLAQARVPAP